MKKVILIFLAAIAFSCGGNGSHESATNNETENNSNYSDDALEADTTDMRMDTTSSPGMNRGYDNGANQDTTQPQQLAVDVMARTQAEGR